VPENEKPQQLNILVIEDNQMFNQLAVEMLSGNHVISAKDAAGGIAQYKAKNPDITFLDIGLPDKSGHDVLAEILAINPKAFVVMLTASNLQNDVQESLKKGAKGYVIKPFSRKKLKDIIDNYINSKK
jgi:two-component system chemotaxis response regulator CheY